MDWEEGLLTWVTIVSCWVLLKIETSLWDSEMDMNVVWMLWERNCLRCRLFGLRICWVSYHGPRGVPWPWGVPWPSRGVPWPLYEDHAVEWTINIYYRCASARVLIQIASRDVNIEDVLITDIFCVVVYRKRLCPWFRFHCERQWPWSSASPTSR